MNYYHVYICSGKGDDRRESGSYTTTGRNYIEAAFNFSSHWNRCTAWTKFGKDWSKIGSRLNMPIHHRYLKDNIGNMLLILKQEI
jgi:hypothetical protein